MMPAFKYIGPRILRAPGVVEIEVPDRAFRTAVPGQVSALRRHRKEVLAPGETRRPAILKDSTIVNIPTTDPFLVDWFRLARSVEGLPLFKEIP